MAGKGGPAQARRRARRAAARQQGKRETLVNHGIVLDHYADVPFVIDLDEFRAYVGADALAASGSTSIESPWNARAKAVIDGLIASGEPIPHLVSHYDLTRGSLAERFFYDAAIDAGFTEYDSTWWPTEEVVLAPESNVVYRANANEHVVRFDDGSLAHVQVGYGMIHVCAVGPTGRDAVASYRETYPASFVTDADDSRVPITFWMMGGFGPVSRLRRLDAQPWTEIERNYSTAARTELDRLMSWSSGDDANGQLLLWQGDPGTGKTWALRALASEWAPWAEFHYITDPDVFFGQTSSYMIDVLLSDSYMALDSGGDVVDEERGDGKWKVMILEDTGDLLASDARDSHSAGLSRLLNVVDGMIGQGLRVLVLVTTNDQIDDFHPAVVRPGRCASQLSFGPLDAAEASEWLGETVEEGGTIAELFARRATGAEPFDAAQTGACAACVHDAIDHFGDMNDGRCSMDSCDCTGFKIAAAVEDAVAAAAGNLTITFTNFTIDGVEFDTTNAVFEGATNPDMPPEHQTKETLPPKRPTAKTPPVPGTETDAEEAAEPVDDAQEEDDEAVGGKQGTGQASMSWTAVFAPEGRPTDDGRIFAPGAITWRELPLSLGAMFDTPHADVVTASPVVGRIDRIYRSGDQILGEGVFDNSDLGREVARMVTDGTLTGVSVDIAVSKMEIAWKSEILDVDGNWTGGDGPSADGDEEGPNLIDILFDADTEDQVMYVVWEGTIGAVTICPFPAFAEAHIEPASSLVAAGSDLIWTVTGQHGMRVVAQEVALAASAAVEVETQAEEPEALTASVVAPETPPAWWFDDPEFEELTALTVEDDGRIYGHAAPWDTCHIGIPGVCTTAPHSETGYAYFHLKEVECDGGERVSCGTITLGTGHANRNLGRAAAAAHYDDTGSAVADVVCGEDEHGIWYAGALRPHLDEKTVREFRGAAVSGDWRNVNGNLEFIALLAVNVPGFPVPKVRAMVASGENGFEVLSLTAAGIHAGQEGLTRNEQAQFDALREELDGGWDDLAASLEES